MIIYFITYNIMITICYHNIEKGNIFILFYSIIKLSFQIWINVTLKTNKSYYNVNYNEEEIIKHGEK
jgi:hypothetical protein